MAEMLIARGGVRLSPMPFGREATRPPPRITPSAPVTQILTRSGDVFFGFTGSRKSGGETVFSVKS